MRDDTISVSFEVDTFSFGDASREDFEANDVSSVSTREEVHANDSYDINCRSQIEARQVEIVLQMKALQSEYEENKRRLGVNHNATTIQYIHNGWVGKVQLDENEMLTLEDFNSGLEPIPPSLDDKSSDETRRKKNYEVAIYGSSASWVPCGTLLRAKNKEGAVEDRRDVVKAFESIFGRKKCMLSTDSLGLLCTGTLFAPGCSDEGAIFIMGLTVKCIVNEIEERTGVCLDITNQDIAHGLPSRATLVKAEEDIAAMSLLKTAQELIVNCVKYTAGQGDHGNRSGIDHYPKTLHYSVKDKDGKWKIRRPTLDVDSAGHTATECATAWELSLDRLPGLTFLEEESAASVDDASNDSNMETTPTPLDSNRPQRGRRIIRARRPPPNNPTSTQDISTATSPPNDSGETLGEIIHRRSRKRKVDMIGLTGDRGGGANIQNMHPAMKVRRLMGQTSIATSCTLHGSSKSYENAWTSTMGKQGIGCRSPSQMMFVFGQFQKAVKREVELKGLQEFVGELIHKLMSDAGMQTEGNKQFKQAYDEFMSKLDDIADLDVTEDELQKLFNGTYELPTNLQDAVFSRWMTIVKAVEAFVENWTKIYFLAASVKQWTRSTYIQTLANTLLSLMNTRSKAENSTRDQEQDTTNYLSDNDLIDSPLKPGDSPTFYVMLLFAQAFGRRYYVDHFSWQLKDHHYIGKGSNGHTAPDFCPRVALMVLGLDEMIENDGFYHMPEFSRWVKSLEGVPEVAKDAVNREYHMNVARKFLVKFRLTLQKHIVEQWTDGSKTHYMLAADPEHATSLARILVDARAELEGVEKQDDEYYELPDRDITLPYYHTMTRGPVVCNLKQTMTILTDNLNFEEVLSRPFVVEQWEQIVLMAEQSEPVDIWNDNRFVKLRDAAICQILIHPIHQQQSELMVQAAALVAKTHVDEDRRTNRTISITNIVRPANAFALAQRNDALWAEGKDPVNCVQGSHRVGPTLDFIDAFRAEANEAIDLFGDGEYRDTVKKLHSKSKQSAAEKAEKIESFKKSLLQPRKRNKAEMPLPHEIPPEMGGGILWRMLTKSNGALDAVHAEMKIRHIPMSESQEKRWTIGTKRKKLRVSELARLSGDGTGKATMGLKESDVTYIVPLSDEMKDFMTVQMQILNREQGIEDCQDL